MTGLPPEAPLVRTLGRLLAPHRLTGEVVREPLPSSREVYRFSFSDSREAVVGKFFSAYPPVTASDRGLAREYDNYLRAGDLGLNHDYPGIPRLLGRSPQDCLGLLLEAVPGPDLDALLGRACAFGDLPPLFRALENLAELLAFFHSRPLPATPIMDGEALAYLDKLLRQLGRLGLLTPEDEAALTAEKCAWADLLAKYPDRQVLVHGDATPTNFLFPENGRPPYGGAVALDLERLRPADRLWDLSWVAGELKHAWACRTGQSGGAESAISHFFSAYLATRAAEPRLAARLYFLNPFYMALAELRIARNAYLSWGHRGWLVAEARRCLAYGRKL